MKKLMLTILSGLFASSVSAGVIYSNDFSGGDTAGWSNGSIVGGAYQANKKNNGIDNKTIRFNLNDPGINSAFNVSFDAIAIGSWDKNGNIEDWFVTIEKIAGGGTGNDIELFNGNLNRGVNAFSFMNVAAHSNDKLRLRFGSDVTGADEILAIDNVVVTSVSEPGTIALFGLGLLGLGYARRKAA